MSRSACTGGTGGVNSAEYEAAPRGAGEPPDVAFCPVVAGGGEGTA